ncbi:hypothetical protein TNCV_2355431 [Trichonephila clavipes]|nr:hypothetical protein TNCV_2355431 [Trichonephila clavipes]
MTLQSAIVRSFLPASSNGRIASIHMTSDSPIFPTSLSQSNDTTSFKLWQMFNVPTVHIEADLTLHTSQQRGVHRCTNSIQTINKVRLCSPTSRYTYCMRFLHRKKSYSMKSGQEISFLSDPNPKRRGYFKILMIMLHLMMDCASEVEKSVDLSEPRSSDSDTEIDNEISIKTGTFSNDLQFLKAEKTYLMQQGVNDAIFSSLY